VTEDARAAQRTGLDKVRAPLRSHGSTRRGAWGNLMFAAPIPQHISQAGLRVWTRRLLAMIHWNRACRAGHSRFSQTLVETRTKPLGRDGTGPPAVTALASKKSCTFNWSTLRLRAAANGDEALARIEFSLLLDGCPLPFSRRTDRHGISRNL